MKKDNTLSRKEQVEFIGRVYSEMPIVVQNYFRRESELLREGLVDCPLVLEVGSGFGRVLEWIPKEVRYTGMDISVNHVEEAKSRNPGPDWLCGDGTKLPFADETFDAVFCVQNTLGNMEGVEEKVLGQAKRVCRKGGKVILSVYSEDSFETRRLWYDRLVDAGIFRRVWLDPANPRMARSDTGWSSRCFDRNEVRQLFEGARKIEIRKLESFLYFCIAHM